MKSVKILTVLSFLFISCEGGFLSPGVGETDKFASLIERMNDMSSLSQSTLNMGSEEDSFARFEVSGIISVDQISLNTGQISIPKHNLVREFNKAEILRVTSDLTNEEGEFITRIIITYLIATIDVFFSEARDPVTELFYVAEIPENVVFSNRVDIAYQTEIEGYFDTEYGEKLTTINEKVSYAFNGFNFLYVDLVIGRPVDRVLGFGEIKSDKETVGI